MSEDEVKRAFLKVKDDISFLISELSNIKAEISNINSQLNQLNNERFNPTQEIQIPTIQQPTPTLQDIQSNNPTDNLPSQALKSNIFTSSTGNEGVPTNKQTNQQTNQHTPISYATLNPGQFSAPANYTEIQKVSHLLESLDSIKKDLRLKFKRLTKQEMLVFSTIYTLEQQEEASYSSVAKKLNLSESSIRDYTIRLIQKGVPILKEKLDNKRVLLHISSELKKIASLDTILKLREI